MKHKLIGLVLSLLILGWFAARGVSASWLCLCFAMVLCGFMDGYGGEDK